MRSLPPLVLALVLAAAGCVTYKVQQSSLVPAATLPPPPTASGRGIADLYVADSTVSFLLTPELAPNENAGLWIPRTQVDGALTLRPGRGLGLRLLWLDGLPQGAMAASPTTLSNPGGNTWGVGFGFDVSSDQRAPWAVGASLDLLALTVPSHVIAVCVENCPLASIQATGHSQTDTVPLYSVAMRLTWRAGASARLFVTGAIKNHPTNMATFESAFPDGEVSSGRVNVLTGVGAEIQLGEWLSVVPQLQIPLTERPVRYGPIFAVGARATLGQRAP